MPRPNKKKQQLRNAQKNALALKLMNRNGDPTTNTPATSLTASQIYFAANHYTSRSIGKPDDPVKELEYTPVSSFVVGGQPEEEPTVMETTTEDDVDSNLKGRRVLSCGSILSAISAINDHIKVCPKMKLSFAREDMISIKSTLIFKCHCQATVEISSDSSENTYPINRAVAWGAASAPLGHNDMASLLTTLDVPPPSYYSFKKDQDAIKFDIMDAAQKSLKQHGERERAIAIAKGHYVWITNEDGSKAKVPCIRVICDGSWLKRSYGKGFNSNEGMAAIIGWETKKVLFYAVRMKYCYICARFKSNIHHDCPKNWNGPSTAMEADIIREGFQRSIQMHGLVYHQFVGDGDSNVHDKVRLIYEPDLEVDKIECTNHVIRNMNTKLTDISMGKPIQKTGTAITQDERRLPNLENKFRRIGIALRCAVKHWNLVNLDKRDPENAKKLAKDIANIPYHIFGRHQNCASYFKCSQAGLETDQVDTVKELGLFKGIVSALKRPADLARSLIEKADSNVVESFMGVVAKFVEGKRKNLGGGYIYKTRVASAVLSFNTTKFFAAEAYKLQHLKSPCVLWKSLQQRGRVMRGRIRKKKTVRRNLNFHFLKSKAALSYGTDPLRPPKGKADMIIAVANLKEELTVDLKGQEEIEKKTRGQGETEEWYQEKRPRLTASMARRIVHMCDATNNRNILQRLLYSEPLTGIDAIEYGKANEKNAIQAYERATNSKVNSCGLFVSTDNGIFGASPDGTVGKNGLIEIKCPYSIKDATPEDWLKKKHSALHLTSDGTVQLKKDHEYYYQVVMQLHVTNRDWCDFVVWTPNGIFIQRIERNQDTEKLWRKISTKLERFWMEDMAPELVDPIYKSQNTFRIPTYRLEAKAKLIAKQQAKNEKKK